MKQRLTAILAPLVLAAFLATPATAKQTVDRIVAVVGDSVILASELETAVDMAQARMGAQASDMPGNMLQSQVLDQLIMNILQLNRARELGLSVNDNDIRQGIAQLAQQNDLSVEQFLQAAEAQGISQQALRHRLQEDMLIQKVRRVEVMDKITISDEDVSRFLDSRSIRENSQDREYHLLHIRVNIPEDAGNMDNIRSRMEKIREQAISGNIAFSDLAQTYSDSEDAMRGGDMGWLGSAFMPRIFAEVVPQLGNGEVSPVFRGAGAFHLVKVVGIRGMGSADDQQVMVDEVEVRHIVLQPDTLRDDEATRQLAHDIRARLETGADFAALAREYSDDQSTAKQGGSMGWVQLQQLHPREATHVAEMQPGDISPIIQSGNTYLIVEVTDRRTEDKTREAIRHRARQVLGQQKAEEKGRRWLHELRADAYIDIRLPGYQFGGE